MTIKDLKKQLELVILGQQELIEALLIALLTGGHILLEGLPGLGKTVSIKTLSKLAGIDFNRVQFTPDLLPSDLVGTMIYNQKSMTFEARKGPLFSNLILADEINRAPAKVQSALLEVMAEKQISLGDKTHKLDEPFFVMATQNPVEQDGTYELPEAQMDRFLLMVELDYPSKENELSILKTNPEKIELQSMLDAKIILQERLALDKLIVVDPILNYILDIVRATRKPSNYGVPISDDFINFGASPRGSQGLLLAAKAKAYLDGDDHVNPNHVKSVAQRVLQHRIGMSFEGKANNITSKDVVTTILETIPLP